MVSLLIALSPAVLFIARIGQPLMNGSSADRLYQTDDDSVQMLVPLMLVRHSTDDRRCWHVGGSAFIFFLVACHQDSPEHFRLWHD